MQVRWKLFATLAEAAGESERQVVVTDEDPTLREALDALLAAEPALESRVLADDGSLQPHIRVLCDGSDPFHTADGWETDAAGVEEFALFPPVTGG
jgi:molybdopterin synthase sulfur carrier subunit